MRMVNSDRPLTIMAKTHSLIVKVFLLRVRMLDRIMSYLSSISLEHLPTRQYIGPFGLARRQMRLGHWTKRGITCSSTVMHPPDLLDHPTSTFASTLRPRVDSISAHRRVSKTSAHLRKLVIRATEILTCLVTRVLRLTCPEHRIYTSTRQRSSRAVKSRLGGYNKLKSYNLVDRNKRTTWRTSITTLLPSDRLPRQLLRPAPIPSVTDQTKVTSIRPLLCHQLHSDHEPSVLRRLAKQPVPHRIELSHLSLTELMGPKRI